MDDDGASAERTAAPAASEAERLEAFNFRTGLGLDSEEVAWIQRGLHTSGATSLLGFGRV
jgi:hypothetical protein